MIDYARLAQANRILAHVHAGCELRPGRSGLTLHWTDHRGEKHQKRWVATSRGSDFPTIYSAVPFGGTCCCAVMELTRWVRGLPVRPLGAWRRFVQVGMSPRALDLAAEFGWPERVPCVMCGRPLGGGVAYDHYDHDALKAPGPGCWYGEGCKSPKEVAGGRV